MALEPISCKAQHAAMQKSILTNLLLSTLGLVSIGSLSQAQDLLKNPSTADYLDLGVADDRRLQALFRRQYSEGDFLEAAETAKSLIAKLIASDGNPLSRAAALRLLASAQLAGGEAEAAAQNYADAIAMIVDLGDRLSPTLPELLQGLARSQRALGEYRQANETYQQAIHVHRVNYGLHDLQQAGLVGELVDLLVEAGEFDDAYGMQTYKLQVLRNNLDETDPRVITAWDRRGQLLSHRGKHVDAQENYVFAADIVRDVDGPESIAQVQLLRSLSASYLDYAKGDVFTRIEMARGELEKIILILERNPAARPEEKGQAHIDMGNFMLRFGDWNTALRHYRRAWEHLEEDAGSLALRSQYFDGPEAVNLHTEEIPDAISYEEVPLIITIDGRGQVTDVALAEDAVSTDAARRAKSAGRKLRFRPTFREGVPIESESLRQIVTVPMFAAAED